VGDGSGHARDCARSDSDATLPGDAGPTPLTARAPSRGFSKYEERGAYHWSSADRASAEYAPATEARYEVIARQVTGGDRALDVGCGDGYLIARASETSGFVVGVDPEPTGVALARDRLRGRPGCHVIVGRGSELPLPSGSFDAVLLADVIEHLEDPDACLAEAVRVLRPGGAIAVTTPRRLPDHWWDEANHVVEYSSAELRELLLDGVEALAVGPLQRHAGVARVALEALDDALLRRVEGGVLGALAERHEGLVERTALSEAQPERDHLGLHGLVGGAQGIAVAHAHEVADDAPGGAEAVVHPLERLDDPREGRLDACLECLELRGELREQRAHGGLDVLGADAVEGRQAGRVQERIAGFAVRAGPGLLLRSIGLRHLVPPCLAFPAVLALPA